MRISAPLGGRSRISMGPVGWLVFILVIGPFYLGFAVLYAAAWLIVAICRGTSRALAARRELKAQTAARPATVTAPAVTAARPAPAAGMTAIIGTALTDIERLFRDQLIPGQLPGRDQLDTAGAALDDMAALIRDNLAGDSQREAYRRLGCLRKKLADAQAVPEPWPQQAS